MAVFRGCKQVVERLPAVAIEFEPADAVFVEVAVQIVVSVGILVGIAALSCLSDTPRTFASALRDAAASGRYLQAVVTGKVAADKGLVPLAPEASPLSAVRLPPRKGFLPKPSSGSLPSARLYLSACRA